MEAAGPPEYTQSRLWLESLGPESETSHPEQRDRLRSALDDARTNALPIAARIQEDQPDLTVHDEDHLDALWLDALGMALRDSLGHAPSAAEVAAAGEAVRIVADKMVLRERHAEQAVTVATVGLGEGEGQSFLLPDEQLRHSFAHISGKLAASHWWPVSQLRALAGTHLAIAELPHQWEVDALKLACLLRLADYSHLDSRRAPRLRRLAQQPQGEALLHWNMQERLARATVAGSRLRYQSVQPFGRDESDAWWLAADMLSAVDEELRQVDSLLEDLNRPTFAVSGVLGAGDPARLRESVETLGWEPVDARLRVSDTTSLVRRMGGSSLYGARPLVPLREMIQNSRDATMARRAVQAGWDAGSIEVAIEPLDEEWLEVMVRDNGVGMAAETLAGPLLDFGRSLWKDRDLTRLIPGLAATDFEPVGQFGIGFFSVFMWDRPVNVRSRYFTSAAEETYVLEFPRGLSRRAVLRRATEQERLLEPGTIVTFHLRDGADDDAAPLREDTAATLARLCPTLEVDLELAEDGQRTQVINGGDWSEVEPRHLVERLGASATAAQIERMRPLFGPDGEMVGRLVAIPSVLYLGGNQPGVLTIGGLEARRGGSMIGVLLGDDPNLARSSARALASAEEFTRWAGEQAELWVDSGLSRSQAISLAAAIARYGGDIGALPICYGVDGPMNGEQLRGWAAERDEIIFWDTIDDDELRIPGGYDPTFTPGPNTIVIDEGIRSDDLGVTVELDPTAAVSLEHLVHQAVAAAWSQSAEQVDANAELTNEIVIGHSEVDEIFSSTALLFRREIDG